MTSTSRSSSLDKLRIALVCLPGRTVPPFGYGPVERVLDGLARGLKEIGHEVTLFAAEDSTCPVPTFPGLGNANPDDIDNHLAETRHVLDVYEALALRADEFDIVHDHTLIGPLHSLAFPELKVMTTYHGPWSLDLSSVYVRLAKHLGVICVSKDHESRAPVPVAGHAYNSIDTTHIPFGNGEGDENGEYLLCMARITGVKGISIAIDVAKRADMRLKIVGRVLTSDERDYFQEQIAPRLDDQIEFLGEIGGDEKYQLLGNATGFLSPMQWDEPFGLAMIEAQACGTPVIATPRGAASEIIVDKKTGMLCEDVEAMAIAVKELPDLSREACRKHVAEKFSPVATARQHSEIYGRYIEAKS